MTNFPLDYFDCSFTKSSQSNLIQLAFYQFWRTDDAYFA